MQLSVSEILSKVSKLTDYEDRKNSLATCSRNQAVIAILQLAYDYNLTFNVPEGTPPYKPCQFLDQQAMLYNYVKKMYLFLGDGAGGTGKPKLPQLKRESLFVAMLESLDPEDAKLMVAVKDRNLTSLYENITEELVRDTFPKLLPPPIVKKVPGPAAGTKVDFTVPVTEKDGTVRPRRKPGPAPGTMPKVNITGQNRNRHKAKVSNK
jgi:hypothetical protein